MKKIAQEENQNSDQFWIIWLMCDVSISASLYNGVISEGCPGWRKAVKKGHEDQDSSVKHFFNANTSNKQ